MQTAAWELKRRGVVVSARRPKHADGDLPLGPTEKKGTPQNVPIANPMLALAAAPRHAPGCGDGCAGNGRVCSPAQQRPRGTRSRQYP
eukprot:3851182-Pleurochrysis_carterae.AAC.1